MIRPVLTMLAPAKSAWAHSIAALRLADHRRVCVALQLEHNARVGDRLPLK
jgi:hypothetical protein